MQTKIGMCLKTSFGVGELDQISANSKKPDYQYPEGNKKMSSVLRLGRPLEEGIALNLNH